MEITLRESNCESLIEFQTIWWAVRKVYDFIWTILSLVYSEGDAAGEHSEAPWEDERSTDEEILEFVDGDEHDVHDEQVWQGIQSKRMAADVALSEVSELYSVSRTKF